MHTGAMFGASFLLALASLVAWRRGKRYRLPGAPTSRRKMPLAADYAAKGRRYLTWAIALFAGSMLLHYVGAIVDWVVDGAGPEPDARSVALLLRALEGACFALVGAAIAARSWAQLRRYDGHPFHWIGYTAGPEEYTPAGERALRWAKRLLWAAIGAGCLAMAARDLLT